VRIGHIRAAELILLGSPFDAGRAAEWNSLVRSCLTGPAGGRDRDRENAGGEAIGALQASKRLLKQLCREQIKPR
jgi:enoyl-CoA hydratase/carnithine racemase